VEEVQEVVEQQEITSKYNPNIIVFLPAITIFLLPAFVFYGIACCVTHFIVPLDLDKMEIIRNKLSCNETRPAKSSCIER
jgi:hypothetical protein